MIYPKLVPDSVCKTPIHIVIEEEGLDEDGAPIEAFAADLKCNWPHRAAEVCEDHRKGAFQR